MNRTVISDRATARGTGLPSWLMAAILGLAFCACVPDPAWSPRGAVSLAECYEAPEGGISVTCAIANTGRTAINRTTFSLRVVGSSRVYWKTVSYDLRIVPGGIVRISVVVPFAAVGETLLPDGLTMADCFFE